MIYITVAGDFCITPPFVSNNLITPEVEALFKKSDINIVNLECPVSLNSDTGKLRKTGPHLHTSEQIFEHLKKLNVDIVTLANNHILDFGEEALDLTLESCKQQNIKVVGAGKNISEASHPLTINSNGVKVAIVNFCENEWSIAKGQRGGANPLDLIDNLQQIKAARNNADFVIVIIHGGHEYYNLPSPRMVKQYRFFAENGADAIIGHHSHCIGGFEVYKNVPIFYSLGNMLFTLESKYKEWYSGLVVQLNIEKGKSIDWELHPIKQDQNSFVLTLPEGIERREILQEVQNFSKIIANEEELLRNWDLFVKTKKKAINVLSPINIFSIKHLRAAFNRLGFNKIFLNKNFLVPVLNQMRCEAHRDVILELIDKKLENK